MEFLSEVGFEQRTTLPNTPLTLPLSCEVFIGAIWRVGNFSSWFLALSLLVKASCSPENAF